MTLTHEPVLNTMTPCREYPCPIKSHLFGYKMMIQAEAQGHSGNKMLLLTPTPRDDSFQMAYSAVDISDSNCVCLM